MKLTTKVILMMGALSMAACTNAANWVEVLVTCIWPKCCGELWCDYGQCIWSNV